MKLLTELNPKWLGMLRKDSGEGLSFDCPVCGPQHPLVVYFKNPRDGGNAMPRELSWTLNGSQFDTATIQPSIKYECFHGWVEYGRVFNISESPLTIWGDPGTGIPGPIALSPMQARSLAESVIHKADTQLGD